MQKKISYLIMFILLFSVLTGSVLIQNVKGNSGLRFPEDGFRRIYVYHTYLKNVNVTLDIFKEYGEGHGEFTFFNPSNSPEFLELYFNPGHESKETIIAINGEELETGKQAVNSEYNDYYSNIGYYSEVTTFNFSIDSNSSLIAYVDWIFDVSEFDTQYDSDTEDIDFNTTTREVNYLIIGPSICEFTTKKPCIKIWNSSIDEVCVTFDIHCEEFRNFKTNVEMHNTTNSEGYPILTYCVSNYSDIFQKLRVTGFKTPEENEPEKHTPGFELILIFLGLVILIYYKERKKR